VARRFLLPFSSMVTNLVGYTKAVREAPTLPDCGHKLPATPQPVTGKR